MFIHTHITNEQVVCSNPVFPTPIRYWIAPHSAPVSVRLCNTKHHLFGVLHSARVSVCLSREDEAWLDIKLHCTSKDPALPSSTNTPKPLGSTPHLPGAADGKPSGTRAVASRPDAVSLSDVTYDGSSSSSWASASAFFLQPWCVLGTPAKLNIFFFIVNNVPHLQQKSHA